MRARRSALLWVQWTNVVPRGDLDVETLRRCVGGKRGPRRAKVAALDRRHRGVGVDRKFTK